MCIREYKFAMLHNIVYSLALCFLFLELVEGRLGPVVGSLELVEGSLVVGSLGLVEGSLVVGSLGLVEGSLVMGSLMLLVHTSME